MKTKTTEELVQEYHNIVSELQLRHTLYTSNLSIDDYQINGEEDFEIWLSLQ